MSTLVALSFAEEKTAFDVRDKLVSLQQDYLIELDDAVVVTKNDENKVKLHQSINLTAVGAVGGTFWGMLVGMIFLNPLIGAAVGASSGAITGALTDIGVSDDFMKETGESLESNGSMLFVLIRSATTDKVLDALKGYSGKVIQTSLSKDKEEQIREVFSAPAVQEEMKAQEEKS